ncbi:hypothetical protein [Clostridium sp.]|uniref:hypothetical protein n=1 Tax=Clostridium sp. TaxID=1506 RepID=UPI001A43D347|nr:hypothetical protein [Clostridium sp.]MBK5241678.1 hypothetical protein [Clostridium sp.]
MFIVNTSTNLESIKNSNLFTNRFIEILSDDLLFLLDDLSTSDVSDFCSLIAISPTSDIKEINIKGVDILKSCKIVNICLYPNNITKATVIIHNNYWVSIYFNRFINSHLTSWIYKEKVQ